MFQKKGQTATEYLIISAVVIIIALLVVSILGGIPGLGSGTTSKAVLAELGTRSVGITQIAFTDEWSKFELRNNEQSSVSITSLWVDQTPCASDPLFPFTLRTGKRQLITCWNINTDDENFDDIVVDYIDTKFDASFNTASKAASSYKGTTTTDCWGDQTTGAYHICTCDDLDKINDNTTTLGYDYVLHNNIDFLEPSCQSYRTGEGWRTIGNGSNRFSGDFDGQNHVIKNVFIDRSDNFQGLFGRSTSTGIISNLGVVNADVTGLSDTGIFLGNSLTTTILDSYGHGKVSGSSSVGGLIGYSYGGSITNSYFAGDVSGSENGVGGLTGGNILSLTYVEIESSYARGTVSGAATVGGLTGYLSYVDISNSYSDTIITGNSQTGGLVALVGLGGTFTNNTWVNNSDSANLCESSGTYDVVGQCELR